MKPRSISENLMYCTVRIECTSMDGQVSTGSGFILNYFEKGENSVPVIVTNKHVIDGAMKGTIHFNIQQNGEPVIGKYYTLEIDSFQSRWIYHPNKEIDLCIMPIAPLVRLCHEQGVELFYRSFSTTNIPSRESLLDLTTLEEITMIGYPNGIWDSINNFPVFRKGVTATHPAIDYRGKEEFLIDCACFPGSSGSPVILLNQGSFPTRDGGIQIGNRFLLLGVLYAGPQHTATGEVRVVDIPTKNVPISISTIPNNLGYVIKSIKLLDFEEILKQIM